MIEEFARAHYDFNDALINEFRFFTVNGKPSLEILITCMNDQTDDWHTIRIVCTNVVFFKFRQDWNTSSTVVNTALTKTEGDMMTIDFFPYINGSTLEENPESDFIVKFKNFTSEIIRVMEPSMK